MIMTSNPKEALERLKVWINAGHHPQSWPKVIVHADDLRTLIAEREGLAGEVDRQQGEIEDLQASADTWLAEHKMSSSKLAALEEASGDLLKSMSSIFKSRNGREVGIEADDGEKCWIVHSDQIEALRALLHPAVPVETEAQADQPQGLQHPTPPDGLASSGDPSPVQDVVGDEG